VAPLEGASPQIGVGSHRVADKFLGSARVEGQPVFFRLSADDIRYLRIAAEVIASNKPLTQEQRSDLSRAMLALLEKAEPI
jgi:hypothetical protein